MFMKILKTSYASVAILSVLSGAVIAETLTVPANVAADNSINFTTYQTSSTPGAVTTATDADSTGSIVFTVGATPISDPDTPSLTYQDAAYSGEFDVTVDYQ